MHMRRGTIALAPLLAGVWLACSDSAVTSTSTPPLDGGSDAMTVGLPAEDAGLCSTDQAADGLYKHLECTGLYASFTDKTVATDALPYKPAVEFWSDGAAKLRWLSLPAGTKIDITSIDEWKFPVGTRVWKEFKLGGKRIETRFYTKLPDDSWKHTTYRWSDDESTATRLDVGAKIPGIGPDGGVYEVPDSNACDQCHDGRTDQLLGIEAVNLGLPGATGLTLDALAASGYLSATPPRTTLALPGDATAQAALGFLHTNCGACHNDNSNALARSRAHLLILGSELMTGTPVVTGLQLYKQAYCQDARMRETDGTPYKYILGGSTTRSLASVLSGYRVPTSEDPDDRQMPPIVTRAVDVTGHAALDAWIATLPPCN